MDVHKIAVISGASGGFDEKPKHIEQSVNADYFYFTDDNFPLRNSMTPHLQAKIPKMFGWQMVPNYDYYLWLDGNIALNNVDALKYFLEEIEEHDIVVLKHHRRNTIKWEARYLERALKEQSIYMVNRYNNEFWKEQYWAITDNKDYKDDKLYIGGIFMYRNTKEVQESLKEWWYHVSRYCIQDQISFPYAIRNLKVKVLDHDHTKWDFIKKVKHNKNNE